MRACGRTPTSWKRRPIQFQKNERVIVADSTASQKVSTVLVGTDKSGKPTVVTVTANHLTYRDSERKAHFEGECHGQRFRHD